jgi:ubiquinone/menaquinone biosynthesis C-methylase UbiE
MSAGSKKQALAQDAYNTIAEAYAQRIDTKPHNAYYERPATLSLLPVMNGKRVLDTGCGPGVYAEWLVAQGADVVVLDANAKMVRLARQRLGDKVKVLQANLTYPLDFLSDASFDIVLSALVMDYVLDWTATFSEFHRLLVQAGTLVFSIGHPFEEFDLRRQTSNYFKTVRVEYTWNGFSTAVCMPNYRRPFS